MKKALKWLVNGLPYVFFLVAIVLIIQVAVSLSQGKTPSVFGYSIFSVTTPSMEPAYMTHDLIFVKTIDPDDLFEDDVITYYRPDDATIIITHRIKTITESDNGRIFTTLGDNNHGIINDWEQAIPEANIIGKVTGKSTFLGKVYQTITANGINLIYGVAIGIFLLIGVFEIVSITKEVKLSKNTELLKTKDALVEEELKKLKEEAEKNQMNSK